MLLQTFDIFFNQIFIIKHACCGQNFLLSQKVFGTFVQISHVYFLLTYIHTLVQTYIHTHTREYIYILTHTHTHTHTHYINFIIIIFFIKRRQSCTIVAFSQKNRSRELATLNSTLNSLAKTPHSSSKNSEMSPPLPCRTEVIFL